MKSSVKEWMTGDPVSIVADAPALAALDAMIDRGIRHLPVVDFQGRVVGVVSIDDLRAALPMEVNLQRPPSALEREASREVLVGDLMTYAPDVIQGEASLADAAQCMADRRIGCLPVVDARGRLKGILSETDVLQALATRLWTDQVRDWRGPEGEAQAFLDSLQTERERLRKEVLATQREEEGLFAESQGSGLDDEERAADREAGRLAASLHEQAIRRLSALDRALARATTGNLPSCEHCGRAIPIPRLRALPGTTSCVACARRAEH
jgi:acetoin utilization protein AcuB